jgi:hypothetical protein
MRGIVVTPIDTPLDIDTLLLFRKRSGPLRRCRFAPPNRACLLKTAQPE